MSRFGRRADAETARQLTEVHHMVVELRERLAEEQQTTAVLQDRLHHLERRNIEIAAELHQDRRQSTDRRQAADRRRTTEPVSEPTPPAATRPLPPPRLPTPADRTDNDGDRTAWELEELRLGVDRLTARVDELAAQMERRLAELGFEIERTAASSQVTAAVSDLALDRELDSLRDAQLRLAHEQARYEIAIRAELAQLADRLRTT